ncbi:MAG: APC family permease [Aeromicrobium sp.]
MGEESNAKQADSLQRGSLGWHDIVFFVVAAAAPLTVMAAVAPIALLIGGVGAPAGYLAAGAISAVFAVGFTRMAPHVHNNGAFYSYIRQGLGRAAGLASALVAVVSYNLLQFSVYGLFGAVAGSTVKDFLSIDGPWWCWALVGVVIVGLLGYRSVQVGAKVLAAILVAEVIILMVLAVAVIVQGGADGLTLAPYEPSNVFTGQMGAVLAVAFAAFVGFESTALYRDEAHDPARAIPRATYVAVGFLALFYSFIVWIAVMAFGMDGVVAAAAKDPAALFFTAMDTYVGGWATDLMRILIVSSGLAALLSLHNAVTRYGYALGSEAVLPKALARIHPEHRSPYVGSLVQSAMAVVAVLAFAIAGTDPVLEMAAWTASAGAIGVLALQALTSVSIAVFFRSGPHRSAFTSWVGVLSVVLLAAALWLVLDHLDIATLTKNVAINVVVVAVPVMVFVAGLAYAAWLRSSRPDVYGKLGTANLDEPLSA